MSVGLLERPVAAPAPETSAGGVPARQAMIRWAWRLFRREWRQQVLILALVVLAVAATVVGAAVAVNTPPPANAGYGSANHMGTFAGNDPRLATQISTLEQRFGQVDVIENQTLSIPGSVETYDLRAQDPNGAFGTPMLSVVSGHFPGGPGEVALTPGLASALGLKVGDTWDHDGTPRTVVGIVQNPQSLLDAFALVVPGQVKSPTQATVLFDATVPAISLGPNFSDSSTPGSTSGSGALQPDTIVLTLATLGMLLIALVSVGGFTVLAQRRLRAIGMLESMGATDKNVRLVMRANGVIVGVVGALAGFLLGLVLWLAYRPRVEQNAHHLIGAFAVPWVVVLPAMALAVAATTFAAGRPARAIAKVPVVTALAGRPAPPKPLHRSAVPGVVVFVIAFVLFGLSGGHSRSGGGAPELVLGLVALIVAIILLSPLALTVVGKIGSKAPVAARLAMRDLARYRSRSGSALAAISLGVLIAVIVCGAAAARYGNVLDYTGPNLASNQLVVYAPQAPPGNAESVTTEIAPNINGTSSVVPNGNASTGTPPSLQSMVQAVHGLAAALGTTAVELDATSANLNHNGPGRQFSGQIYVATPALLKAYGIKPSSIDPKADILTMRAGLPGTSDMQLQYGAPTGNGGPEDVGPNAGPTPCPATSCVANPVIQEVGALPAGTSAPNTVVTEHAVRSLHLESSVSPVGWLLQAASPLTAVQIDDARQTAATTGMTVESKNDAPSASEIINWATVFGIVLALGVLAMSVGLIRSETSRDLRTLTATGASSATRRSITAVTAGALGFVGAVLGTVAGYIALTGWFRSSELNGGLSALAHVPWFNLFLLVVAMPLAAAAIGWLLAGREPSGIATRPTE